MPQTPKTIIDVFRKKFGADSIEDCSRPIGRAPLVTGAFAALFFKLDRISNDFFHTPDGQCLAGVDAVCFSRDTKNMYFFEFKDMEIPFDEPFTDFAHDNHIFLKINESLMLVKNIMQFGDWNPNILEKHFVLFIPKTRNTIFLTRYNSGNKKKLFTNYLRNDKNNGKAYFDSCEIVTCDSFYSYLVANKII